MKKIEEMTFVELETREAENNQQIRKIKEALKALENGRIPMEDWDLHFDNTIYSDEKKAFELKMTLYDLGVENRWIWNNKYKVKSKEDKANKKKRV